MAESLYVSLCVSFNAVLAEIQMKIRKVSMYQTYMPGKRGHIANCYCAYEYIGQLKTYKVSGSARPE